MSKLTIEQMAEFFRQQEAGRVTRENFQIYLESLRPVATLGSDEDQLLSWKAFYLKVFGIKLDLAGLELPATRVGFDRLVVVAEDLAINSALQACRDHFSVYSCWDNLDKEVSRNDRSPSKTYVIRLRDRIEADEEFADVSANQLKERGVKGITLLERLLLELMYFTQTGKHLDLENVTLCAGSRGSYGSVPSVDWDSGDDGLRVHWYSPGDSHDGLLTREVVSSQP